MPDSRSVLSVGIDVGTTTTQLVFSRLTLADTSIVIATDHEHGESDLRAGFLDFCSGAEYLIYDAMYTPEEYVDRIGWGHGNWQQGVQLALEAGISELILTHHEAGRTDAAVDAMVERAREFFPRTRAAVENMVLAW